MQKIDQQFNNMGNLHIYVYNNIRLQNLDYLQIMGEWCVKTRRLNLLSRIT